MQKKLINEQKMILKISSDKDNKKSLDNFFVNDFFNYQPSISEPKGYNSDNNYYKYNNNESSDIIDKKVDIMKRQNTEYELESTEDNVFINCHELTNNIPSSTSIHCFWCCHQFNSHPCVLPISLNKKKFSVTGCFCSPECASAYNFKNYKHDCWEYNSLLNYLYKITYKNNNIKIKPAPPRETLKIFGGKLSIEQFRSSYNYSKNHVVYYPPMNILRSRHEINNDNSDNNLKIKRSQPLKSKNTLDKFIITK